ncbi:MAG TPA: IPT/TIG domain-containing protein [Thermoanaerobaculia bacterium]|jgi:hypothetical protein|nr:IPT/TIG domain-containing protein [Thermoanaerobaculia bacterium]
MSVLSRHFLLALAIVYPCFGNASASPAPRPKTAAKAPAVPNGTRHAPIPVVQTPYAGAPPVAIANAVRTPPLSKMKVIPPPFHREDEDRFEPVHPARPTDTPAEDGRRQMIMGPASSAPVSTGLSFEGVGTGLSGFFPCCVPPDTNGHVGATQYVQWNNLSFAVWDKSGNKLYGPAAGNTLFQPLGGVCASHNDGDPVVNYDILAGRWILSQLAIYASPGFSHQCVAVSLTSDATGAWYLYDFVTDPVNFVDYPHMAVWSDGYYMAAHIFDGSGFSFLAGRIYAFERDKMLNGQPARMLSKDLKQYGGLPQYGFLAADLDSLTPPPIGEAEFVIGPDPASTSFLDSARVAVTWGATPAIAFSETQISASWGIPPCVNGAGSRACVPQPPPAVGFDDLDNLDQHMMHRLGYRNFGGSPVQESLVGNITVPGSTSTPPHGAIRWYEFQNAGDSSTTPTVYQAGTFDPDSDYRWMGSVAMDKDHDIALGYSKSSITVKPSIFVNGRLGTDPINTLGTETQMMAGGGVQFSYNRWGDYSSMTLDPIDQCTFWYTNEYLQTDGAFNWATRIGAFKFPSCTPVSWGNVSGTVTSCATGAPIGGVIVSLGNGYAVASDASGHYSVAVPAGTYTATAAGADLNCSSSSPATVSLIVPADGVVTQDYCMSGSSNLAFGTVSVSDTAAGNGNGIINRNECVDLSVTIANNGCANESAIGATLTTSTAGVTVTQGSSFYPNLAIGASGANSIPFKVSTSPTFVCGTVINLTLNLTYAGGSKSVAFTVPTCGNGGSQAIPASSLTLSDPKQTDRFFRDGIPSTCSGKFCEGALDSASQYNYKTFTFSNVSAAAACVTVTIDATGCGNDIQSQAYLGSSYNPPTFVGDPKLCVNYLGDSAIGSLGTSVNSVSYSFNVPALSDFVVVVNTVNSGTTCTHFSGTVSGLIDETPGPGPCPTCTPPATPAITPGGPTTFCAPGSVTLTSSAASGNQWYLNGAPIVGATGASQAATASGSYTVTTTANSCTSAPAPVVTVMVNPIPVTPTPSNGGPYCEGSTIFLSTPAAIGATYAWTGPNGFTSSLQNPTRANATIADAGTYSVTVTVTVSGCTSAGATSVVVNPLPATPAPSNGGPFCAGQTISLSTPAVIGATYAWTGPNGFTSTLQNPTLANAAVANAGTYFLTVTVNGCPSAGGTTQVVVSPIPATPVASNGGPFCAGSTITLSTPAVANATYAWTGPNGFTSAQQNPTHANAATADAGAYSVTITVNGCTSAAGTTNVVVNTAIPATPTAGNSGPFCEGSTIALSTPAVANATYAWTGPNGFTSSQQNPTRVNATAADAGTYSVTINVGGCSSNAGTTAVVVTPQPATPAGSNGGPYCEGSTIALSTPAVIGATYAWTGPNGFASGLQNPTHANATVADFGTYAVTITVNGCTSAAGTTNVIDANAAAVASNTGPYCAGDTIALSTPAVPGATYAWTGPNGFTSALQSPTHSSATAADAGTYSVIVTTSDCTSLAGSTSVVVNTSVALPAATNGGPYCEGDTISLSTPSVPGVVAYAWTGPNGFTSSLQNPTIASATIALAGTYSLTLFNGCTSTPGDTTVVVNPAPATPTASNSGPFCASGTISLSTPAVTGATYAWTGSNGFTSSQQNPTHANATAADAGTYSVTVTVNGCTSPAGTTNVVVNTLPTPSPANGGPYCTGSTIALATPIVAGATYAWSGPNGFASSLPNPTRVSATVADAGTYSVTVTVNACTSPAGTTDVIVNAIPAMPAATNDGPYCSGATISLSTPAVTGATYAWAGPNGFTSSQQNPTRANAATADAGTYSVTVTTNGCTSPAGTTSVVVHATPATPAASNTGPFCTGGTIALSTPSVTGATYAWTGPNGFASSQQNPTHPSAAPADAGTYSVTVTVNGCTSAAGTTNVVVIPLPATPTATNGGPYCVGGTISLSTPTVAGATYAWTGPAGFSSSQQNPTVVAVSTVFGGTYSVTVSVNGCASAPGTTNVLVTSVFTPFAENFGPYCAGATLSLESSFENGTYAWTGPNGFTSSLENPTRANLTAADAGTYSVTVSLNGCTSAAGTTNVVVNPSPATPTITVNGPTTFCAGGSVTLTSSSATGNEWLWNGSPISFSPTLTAYYSGSYTLVVLANNCWSAASPAVNVIVNQNPNATISTTGSSDAGLALTATVADAGAGATYAWIVTNGTITSGTGTRTLGFTAGTLGVTSLSVTVAVGGCTDTRSANIPILPSLYTVTPSVGRIAGGTNVTISGSGLQSGCSVTFDGIAATNVVRVNANTITATTPAHASGPVTVTLTNPDSFTTSRALFTYGAQQFDANGDGTITSSDIFYLVNYLFLSGPPPKGTAGMLSGDANSDGKVNSADIFYLVNYLFLHGPAPASAPSPVSALSVGAPFSGSVTLGEPIRNGNHYTIPVIMAASPGSAPPQALSLRVTFRGDPVSNAAAHSANGVQTLFEISRPAANTLSYLVTFAGEPRGVVAEIELDASRAANVSVDVDPAVTLLANRAGTRSATPAAGTLQVSDTKIEAVKQRAPRKAVD